MNRATVEVYLTGHSWVAHREDGHDCTADDAEKYHGVADSEVGALRRLIKLEGAE